MFKFEVRQIEGWNYPEGWTWNNSWIIGEYKTKAATTKGNKIAFMNYLNNHGITFKRNRILIIDEMDDLEIIDRKTKEPLFAAIWKGEK